MADNNNAPRREFYAGQFIVCLLVAALAWDLGGLGRVFAAYGSVLLALAYFLFAIRAEIAYRMRDKTP
jgi:hypothetical protein